MGKPNDWLLELRPRSIPAQEIGAPKVHPGMQPRGWKGCLSYHSLLAQPAVPLGPFTEDTNSIVSQNAAGSMRALAKAWMQWTIWRSPSERRTLRLVPSSRSGMPVHCRALWSCD